MAMERAETRPMLGGLQSGIIVLALAAAVAHFYEAAVAPAIRVLFTLNGLGWLILLAAHYLPVLADHHRLTRWALLGYAALNVAAYFAWNFMRGEWTPLGWITVTLEAVLVGLLWLEDRQAEA